MRAMHAQGALRVRKSWSARTRKALALERGEQQRKRRGICTCADMTVASGQAAGESARCVGVVAAAARLHALVVGEGDALLEQRGDEGVVGGALGGRRAGWREVRGPRRPEWRQVKAEVRHVQREPVDEARSQLYVEARQFGKPEWQVRGA
eukprot:4059280-Pleurochrysis_carterae.AAC.2